MRGAGRVGRKRAPAAAPRITILSIMVTWCLENAIETADSMKSRGCGLPGRSAFPSTGLTTGTARRWGGCPSAALSPVRRCWRRALLAVLRDDQGVPGPFPSASCWYIWPCA